MRISTPADMPKRRPTYPVDRTGLCPRMLWRSVNPAVPPPEPGPCLARGPDCCVNAATARRVA